MCMKCHSHNLYKLWFLITSFLPIATSIQPMRWQTPALSSAALQTLLAALAVSRSAPHVAHLHQHLTAAGLAGDPSVATKLLQLYADAGDLPSTLRLFSSLPHPPSVFAWTALLALLSRSGDHRRCLAAYSSMRSAAVSPDAYVFPIVLRSSSTTDPAALHADAVKFAADAALQVGNALTDAYAKAGDLHSARRAFELVGGGRDMLSWNSIIAAYASAGSIDEALDLFRRMILDGWDPDLVTWNTIMDGYCRAGKCDEARDILLGRISSPNVVSWTTVISGYSRGENHEAALDIFSRMIRARTVPPDHETLSCAITSCRHVSAWRLGRAVHSWGLKAAADVGAFYCTAGAALVAMYASKGRISTVESVSRVMDPLDVVTWNAKLLGYARAGLDHVAQEHFKVMLSLGIQWDDTTLSTMLPLCNLRLGKEIHAIVVRHQKGSRNLVWNALISMYSRSGSTDAARRLFIGTRTKDVVTWNTMIGSYGSSGQGKRALELAQEMIRSGVKPNAITFTNVLAGCSHCGLVEEGMEFFDTWVSHFGHKATMEQYACVVDMLARLGRLREAAVFICKMPVAPNARIWGTVLSASRSYSDVEFGCIAFEQLVLLEPENSGNYVTMYNIYARARLWEEANKVRKMMEKEVEMLKPSGCSWLQIE